MSFDLLETVADAVSRGTPEPEQLLLFAPFLLATGLVLHACGVAKRTQGWRTGDTRKAFHTFVYGSAAVILARGGLAPLVVFGFASSAVILHAIGRGATHPHYEALARESDAPHRTRGIVVPYLATLIGGSCCNLLFGPWTVVGFLITGVGDSAGEVVGSRLGRHRYRAPSYGGTTTWRSWEGSAAVFVGSALSILLALLLHPELPAPSVDTLLASLAIAAAVTALEAVAPHGWDNLGLMLLGSGMAGWLLG